MRKMKNIKRLASLLLAVVMVLAMAIPVFAAGDTIPMEGPKEGGKVTIDPAVSGQKYDLYQILYLESYSITNTESGAGQYSYRPTSAWENFLKTTEVQEYITLEASGYVKWNGDPANSRAQEFSRLALKYAKDNAIKPVDTQTAAGTSVVFDNLKLGYYLVDTTVGTMCILNTTNPEFKIYDKNRTPGNIKTIQENGDYKNENDVSIGSTINYKSTINAQMGAQNYVLHDSMEAGIDFTGITEIIKVDGDKKTPLTAFDPENTDPNQKWDYKLVRPAEGATALADGCTFHVEFSQPILDTMLMGSSVDVYYTGKLNQSAVVGAAGNINTSWLSYGEKGDMKTLPSQTNTKTWEFSIFKFTETVSRTRQALPGATFKVCLPNDEGKAPGSDAAGITFSKVAGTDNTYKYDPNGDVSEFTTGDDGIIYLQGFDQATYYLYEIDAPAGYNKITSAIAVNIGKDGVVYQYATEAPNKQIAVENNAGSLLPSTGGIGTTIFYIVGGVLLIGAGVLLVVRKRMSASKESK